MPLLFFVLFLFFGIFFVHWLDEEYYHWDYYIMWKKYFPSTLLFLSWEVTDLNFYSVDLSLELNKWSLGYLSALSLIVMCTSSFSLDYMEGDIHEKRMGDLVFVFVLSMFTVVMSENVFTMVLGWEGLGVSSYALIIYYQDKVALNAGYLTAMSMRVGDLAFIILISLVLGTGDFNLSSGLMGMGTILAICCMTKSATVPFCAWLPAAMSAPTPVSALVHSSTLVTAGVCFLISSYSCLEGTFGQTMLVFCSLVTMVLAGTSALVENDLKKIVALSTMSQISVMVLTVGVGSPELAFFHMVVHAFIKAGMFISVGVLIHMNLGEQDLREFDWGILSNHPMAVGGLICGSLSLMGMPFLSGFYSKEAIIGFFNSCSYSMCYYMLFYSGLVLTTSYTLRLVISLGLKAKSKMTAIDRWDLLWWWDFYYYSDYSIGLLFLLSMYSGSFIWVSLIDGVQWMGVMVIGPEFVFKMMGLAVLLGIYAGTLEDLRSRSNTTCVWTGNKCGFFPSMWYIGSLSGQPMVEGFKLWSDQVGPAVEYWSNQVAGKGLWDLGSAWFKKVHTPIQVSYVFIPLFFIVWAFVFVSIIYLSIIF